MSYFQSNDGHQHVPTLHSILSLNDAKVGSWQRGWSVLLKICDQEYLFLGEAISRWIYNRESTNHSSSLMLVVHLWIRLIFFAMNRIIKNDLQQLFWRPSWMKILNTFPGWASRFKEVGISHSLFDRGESGSSGVWSFPNPNVLNLFYGSRGHW